MVGFSQLLESRADINTNILMSALFKYPHIWTFWNEEQRPFGCKDRKASTLETIVLFSVKMSPKYSPLQLATTQTGFAMCHVLHISFQRVLDMSRATIKNSYLKNCPRSFPFQQMSMEISYSLTISLAEVASSALTRPLHLLLFSPEAITSANSFVPAQLISFVGSQHLSGDRRLSEHIPLF